MISISIVRDKEGFIWEYTVEGHAGAGEPGNDIVCAAVSAIAYTGVNALEEIAGIKLTSKKGPKVLTEKSGFMKCVIPIDIAEDKKNTVRIILETTVVGFKQIKCTPLYKKYIAILDEEV